MMSISYSELAKQHAHLCGEIDGLTKEVKQFQGAFQTLLAKLSTIQTQAHETAVHPPSIQLPQPDPPPPRDVQVQLAKPVDASSGTPVPAADARRMSTVSFAGPLIKDGDGETARTESKDSAASSASSGLYQKTDAPSGEKERRGSTVSFSDDTKGVVTNGQSNTLGVVATEDEPGNDEDSESDAESDGPSTVEKVGPMTSSSSANAAASAAGLQRSQSKISIVQRSQSNAGAHAAISHIDDSWTEMFFMNEKEGEDHLEKIYFAMHKEVNHAADFTPTESQESCQFHFDAGRGDALTLVPKKARWCRCGVLHPASQCRVTWDVIGMLLVIYDVCAIPIQTAWVFPMQTGTALHVLFVISALYWTLDIVLTFFTATYMEGELTLSLRVIADVYRKGWLPLDSILAMLDWTFAFFGDAGELRKVRILRNLRLARFLKFKKLARALEDTCVSKGWEGLVLLGTFGKIALNVMSTLHVEGCIMYYIGSLAREEGKENWIDAYGLSQSPAHYQYMKVFNWMFAQFSPTPFPWVTRNAWEQEFMLFAIIFSLPVIASSINQLGALASQMNAKARERSRLKRQLEHYLTVNKVPVELSSRILRCTEHKLKHSSSSAARPSALSMLPADMSAELTMAQMGVALTIHPLINLIKEAKLEIVSDLCAAFKLESYGPGSEVFIAGSLSKCMYITTSGMFQLKLKNKKSESDRDQKNDIRETPTNIFKDPEWFAELSLFTRFDHTNTLMTITFGEVYTIQAKEFQTCIELSPVGIVAAYEYGKTLLVKVNSTAPVVKDHLAEWIGGEAVSSTQLSGVLFPSAGGDKNASSTTMASDMEVADCLVVQDFVKEVMAGKAVDTDQLQIMFPELHETSGTYASLDHMDERKRCMLGVLSAAWLVGDNYAAITSLQKDPDKRLQPRTWKKLQKFVKWVDLDETMLHATLVFLSIRGLGKSKAFGQMCPPNARRFPEHIVAYTMTEMRNCVPSVELVPVEMYELMQSALLLQTEFNFGQLLQGENIPFSVALLEETISEKGEQLLKFYLFVLVCLMSGLTGTVSLAGSLFLNEQNATNLLNGVRHLQEVGKMDPYSIYWGYMGKRAEQIGIGYTTTEELAFARLICVTRTVDKKGLGVLDDAWKKLKPDEKQCLVKCLSADGIDKQSFVFAFLPNFFANAVTNPMVGLHLAFISFLDLLDRLQVCTEKVLAMVYTVDLTDLALIISEVKAPQGLKECIKHIKIVQKGSKVALVVSAECRQAAAQVTWRRVFGKDQMPEALKLINDKLEDMAEQISNVKGMCSENFPYSSI